MKRLGAVLVFRDDITKTEAEAALAKIANVLAPNYFVRLVPSDTPPGARYETSPLPPINEFNDDFGGPVWYVP